MNGCLAIDAAPAAPIADLIHDGAVVRRFPLDPPDGLAGVAPKSFTPSRIVHRFPHAPAGAAEVSAPVDARLLSKAGALEPDDTAARIAMLEAAFKRWPAVPQQIVFDTPWFALLPEVARHYGIPPETERKLGLQRVGRHGPVHRLATAGCCGRRVASLFLGYESSAAAVVDGRPVEISAGATGLEGLPGSRTCGDVDPAALLYLMDNLGESFAQVEQAASLRGGWSALAGVETLPQLRDDQTVAGGEALELLVDRCRRVIGSWAAIMDGLDAVVIAGDDDHVDAELVREIAAGLSYLGVGETVPVTRTALTPTLAAALVSA